MGIVSLFYRTAALNLYRFGRRGRSRTLGLGDFELGKLFHYPLAALYSYGGAGAVTLLIGMFGWWMAHFVWLGAAPPGWVALVMGLAVISTTFYGSTFGGQNYNVLGWAFFPIGIYGLMTGQWILAGAAWLAASFGSPTVVVLGGGLSLLVAVMDGTSLPLLALGPAALKLSTHLVPLAQTHAVQQ